MSDNIVTKLDKCIEHHLDAMEKLDVGSDEMRAVINDLVKLYQFRIDEEKIDFDYSNKDDKNEIDKARVDNEKSIKEAQLDLETKKIEQDKEDKSKQREIDKARMDADVKYRNSQLDLEKKKVELDETDKVKRRDIDRDRLKNERSCEAKRIKEQRIDRYFRLVIAAAELVLPLGAYSVLAILGYAREFDGVITSGTLKRVVNDVNIKFRK